MLLSAQLLSGLSALREQAALVRPAIGDELDDAAQRPAGFDLGDDVDEVVARADAQRATGLHERVCGGESLGGLLRAREVEVTPPDGRLADRALDQTVVDLEAPVTEAAALVGALRERVAAGFARGTAPTIRRSSSMRSVSI